MYCSNCGVEIGEDSNFCPKCGKKIGINTDTTNHINVNITSSSKLSEKSVKITYLATICLVLLYIATNLIVEMVKYTEKGLSYDAVNNKVMAHAYGMIGGIIILTIICAFVNKYKFNVKRVGLGFAGIGLSYIIMIVYMVLHVAATPNGMTDSEAYIDMVNVAKGFKVFDILVWIILVVGYGYLSGAKKISLIKDRENEICTALLFGGLGAIPFLLYAAASF